MFSEFVDHASIVNLDALFEQAAGVLAVYDNRRDLAENILAIRGGGQVLAWQFQDTSWPPSWALLRQDNRLYFWIAGTVNFPQLIANIVGVFSVDNAPYGNRVHSFFRRSASTLRMQIDASLPADYKSCDVYFCGHSYGAAVALLIATDWRLQVPAARVEVLALALPKSMTTGFGGTLPQRVIAVNTVGDGVPYLPPNGVLSAAQGPLTIWDLGIPINWTHYGEQYQIDAQGVVSRVGVPGYDAMPDPYVIASTLGAHKTGNYLQWIGTGWKTQINAGPDLAILPIAAELLTIRNAQNFDVNIDLAAFVDVPAQNAQVFLNQDGGPLNEGNLARVENFNGELVQVLPGNAILPAQPFGLESGMPVKILFCYTDGTKAGFSEAWYMNAIPGTGALRLISDYVGFRMRMSGFDTNFEFARVSTSPADGNPTVFYPRDLIIGTPINGVFSKVRGDDAIGSDVGSTALLCVKRAASKSARIFIRGLPDETFFNGGKIWDNAAWFTAFNNWATYVKANLYGFQGVDKTTKEKSAVLTCVQRPDGGIGLTVQDAIFNAPADVGKNFSGRIAGCIWNKNLNGPLIVVCDGVSSFHSLKPIAINNFQLAPAMTFQFARPMIYQPVDVGIERETERKPGRPFGVAVGRAKVKARG